MTTSLFHSVAQYASSIRVWSVHFTTHTLLWSLCPVALFSEQRSNADTKATQNKAIFLLGWSHLYKSSTGWPLRNYISISQMGMDLSLLCITEKILPNLTMSNKAEIFLETRTAYPLQHPECTPVVYFCLLVCLFCFALFLVSFVVVLFFCFILVVFLCGVRFAIFFSVSVLCLLVLLVLFCVLCPMLPCLWNVQLWLPLQFFLTFINRSLWNNAGQRRYGFNWFNSVSGCAIVIGVVVVRMVVGIMQSVHITTNDVSSNPAHDEIYSV